MRDTEEILLFRRETMRAVPTYVNTGTVRVDHSMHAWRWIVWALSFHLVGRTLDRERYNAGFDFGFQKVGDSKHA